MGGVMKTCVVKFIRKGETGDKGDKGDKGDRGDFKSTVFKRTNSTPSTPSGGTYDSPVPSGWSDGIPSGTSQLWATSCTFHGNGTSSGWSTPRPMTDTDTYDVEFSDVDTNPGTPSTNPSNWYDPVTDAATKDFTHMLWRAERECVNGTWGSWVVVRIKGETGDKGDKGDKGDNSITYSISLAGSVFYRNPNTETIYVDIKGKVYRNDGSGTYAHSLQRSDLSLYFLKEDDTQDPVPNVNNINNGYTVSGNTFATKFYNNTGYSNEKAFVVVLSIDGVERARESIQITKNGSNGTNGTNGSQGPRGYRGPALRGPQDWSQMDIGFQFYKGDADTQEPYEDFVVYNGTYYKCKKTHTKTSTNYPGSTADTNNGYWELTTKVGIVAANILFGDHGYFGSAIISGDWMISTNGTIDGVAYNNRATYNGVLAYSLFNPNNPLGKPITLYNWTGTKAIASGTTTSSFTTVSLVAGKTYFVQAAGKTSNANGVVYVRLRNTSTGATYSPVMINGLSDVMRSGYINCTVTGNYYLEMYHTDSYTGTVNSCFMSEKNFAPNYCLDLLTGKTYQGDIYVRGGVRSPFTFLGVNGTFNNDFSDNVAVYSGSASSYSLPWTTDQSGRKIVVTNYYWNGSYSTATGYAELTAPTGKYFYEDGVQKSTLKLSREAVELLGYGDTSSFYGWIVLKRIDLGTNKRYGHQMKMLAVGRVTSKMNSATISYHSFDGTTLTVTKVADEVGKYVISWNNNNWFANANSPFIIATGYGKTLKNDSEFNDTAVFANVAEQTTTSVTIWTADDASRNNGSFNFFIMNFDDWIYL